MNAKRKVEDIEAQLVDDDDRSKFKINRMRLINAFFDQIMPEASAPEMKIVGFILRKTINRKQGEVRVWHAVSNQSFINRLSLSNSTQLNNAMNHVIDEGWLQSRPGRGKDAPAQYALGISYIEMVRVDDDDA